MDRNSSPNTDIIILDESLSARRAWIEIETQRNAHQDFAGRSPQGERG